jgi:hypothetical protein
MKFHQLRIDKVLTTFNIQPNVQCDFLENWLSGTAQNEFDVFEDHQLDKALRRYESIGRGWNEEELKMHFISTVLDVANPNIEKVCKTFFERPLSGIIDNYELNVVCDCLVASYNVAGLPTNPYFFLQEFKQAQRFGRTDPEGQMLVAMLLAQEQNKDEKPLYGCYVIERQWFFTTLYHRNYCSSRAYDATRKAELLEIVSILRHLKSIIQN